jgi:heptosyltransferase-3
MNILIKAPENVRDLFFILPLIDNINKHFESHEISLLCNYKCREVLRLFKHSCEVIPYQVSDSGMRNYKLLKRALSKKRFDSFISYDSKWYFSLLARLKKIPLRVSEVHHPIDRFFFNSRIPAEREFAFQHDTFYNFEYLRKLGISPEFSKLEINQEEVKRGDYIFINLAPFDIDPSWSSRNFARLILRLFQHKDSCTKFRVLYNSGNKLYNKSFFQEIEEEKYAIIKEHIKLIDEKETSFKTRIETLLNANSYIGHNSLYFHLAYLSKKRALALFNPLRRYSLRRLGPLNEASHCKAIFPDVVCGEIARCSGKSCPYFDCMSKLQVNNVIEEYLSLNIEEIR